MDKPRRTNRSRAYYRYHRKRVVKAKSKKYTISWYNERDRQEFLSNPKYVGQLHKGAAYCSCNMCRYEQHHNIPKAKAKATEKYYDKQIEEYFKRED